ncbi:MAG TPA: ATP-binding protein [Ktedonobacteraceae bacterium]|nr:ATP-binding protein [Ktedonobacteraceae bacterium]
MNQSEAILEALPDSVIACDREGKILRINAAARTLFEVPSEAVCRGTDYQQFLQHYEPGDARDARDAQQRPTFPGQCLMSLAMDEEAASRSPEHTLLLQMPSGRTVYVNLWCVPVCDAQQHLRETVYAFHDITHRYHKALHLQRVHEALLSMNEAIGHLPAGLDLIWPEETFLLSPPAVFVAQHLVDVIRQVLNCRRVSLFAFQHPTGYVRYVAGSGLTAEQEQHARKVGERNILLSAPLDETVIARLQANQEVILTSDHLHGSLVYRAGELGIENLLIVPLFLEQQLVGMLSTAKTGFDNAYLSEEVELVKVVATQAVLLMECIRYFQAQTEARAKVRVLQEVQRLSNDFLTLASHELRTPLTGIKGNLQLAQRRLETLKRQVAEQSEHMDEQLAQMQQPLVAASRSAQLQQRMINDIIDDARIQSNQLALQMKRCDLLTLLKGAVDTQQRLVPERTIVLEMRTTAQEVPVLADAERITRVITTYLANALTYSPAQEPVTVRLTVEERIVRVSVHNEGPGIPSEEQKHLWDRLYRAKGSAVQHELDLSVGLGLYLCRVFIERHHGRVEVQSAPGHGATFWFTLPIVR